MTCWDVDSLCSPPALIVGGCSSPWTVSAESLEKPLLLQGNLHICFLLQKLKMLSLTVVYVLYRECHMYLSCVFL